MTGKQSARKRIQTFGTRGELVRVYLLRRHNRPDQIIVQWGPKSAREQRAFAPTKEGKEEAIAFARAFDAKMAGRDPAKRYTNRELWAAFVDDSRHLHQKTVTLYKQAWTFWEEFAGVHEYADALTVQQCSEFRKALDARGLSVAYVGGTIRGVRTVYNWAERRELIAVNKWHLYQYKVAKKNKTKQRAEYTQTEYLAIWGTMDPANGLDWRAYVVTGLLGIYGSRQNEILPMQWDWVSDTAITVPLEYVKQGLEDLVLPMLPQTRELLAIARAWRLRIGYNGPYVFPSADRRGDAETPHYTIQSYWAKLQTHERKAGVPKIRYRAGHAFRRMVVGNLIAQTGDVALALQAIGDRDLSMAKHYAVRRIERVRKALADTLAAFGDGATEVQSAAEQRETPKPEPVANQ